MSVRFRLLAPCGCSSVAEQRVANAKIVGSSPIVRSVSRCPSGKGTGCNPVTRRFDSCPRLHAPRSASRARPCPDGLRRRFSKPLRRRFNSCQGLPRPLSVVAELRSGLRSPVSRFNSWRRGHLHLPVLAERGTSLRSSLSGFNPRQGDRSARPALFSSLSSRNEARAFEARRPGSTPGREAAGRVVLDPNQGS